MRQHLRVSDLNPSETRIDPVKNFSKSNLEVKGKMTPKAADRVGYMLGAAALIAAVLIGSAAILAALPQ